MSVCISPVWLKLVEYQYDDRCVNKWINEEPKR